MKPSSSSSSSSSSGRLRRRPLSYDRLLRLLAVALLLFVTGSLLLSSLRLQCQRDAASSSLSSPSSLRRREQTTPSANGSTCSPTLIDPRSLSYAPPHKFVSLLQAETAPRPLFPTPKFARKHRHLCDATPGYREWSFCLPITARHDLPYCAAADRMDLLAPQTPQTLCYASVLHLLLVDVYDELKRHDAQPALLFGSMLGAVRNGSLIAFTEDADLGYVNSPQLRMRRVQQGLAAKGYHLFRQGVLRVCVAPTHPLAGNLYDPRRDSLHRARHVPYVDLYKMQLAENRREWFVEETHRGRHVPRDKFEPYSQATVNGMAFDTLADPQDFLEHEYGPRWRTPLKRGAYHADEGSQDEDLPEAAQPPRDLFHQWRDIFEEVDGEYDSAVDYDANMPEIGDVETSGSHGLRLEGEEAEDERDGGDDGPENVE